MIKEEVLLDQIEESYIKFKKKTKGLAGKDLDPKWTALTVSEPKRFINDDCTLKREVLKNFRKHILFISDVPSFPPSLMNPKTLLGGGRRGSLKLLRDSFEIVKKEGFLDILKKYPCPGSGNPYVYDHKGYSFTYRWLKHIYSIGRFNKVMEGSIGKDFTMMDIGSSYGNFPYLFKKEYGSSHCALLDFPEQLILAHYFLASSFPEARICGMSDILNAETIDRAFIEGFDFVLIPWILYDQIKRKSLDMIVNFASFGEMSRTAFEGYIDNEPFTSARYLYTQNRFQSMPTYDTDITILDYHLERFKKKHFGICPIFSHSYIKKNIFFYEKFNFSSQYFEFIGER